MKLKTGCSVIATFVPFIAVVTDRYLLRMGLGDALISLAVSLIEAVCLRLLWEAARTWLPLARILIILLVAELGLLCQVDLVSALRLFPQHCLVIFFVVLQINVDEFYTCYRNVQRENFGDHKQTHSTYTQ